jgi:chorismate mutase
MNIERELAALRSEIDRCDDQISDLIDLRVGLVRTIAALKVSAGSSMHDSDREARILKRADGVECEIERRLFYDVYAAIFESGKRLWEAAHHSRTQV